jgi:DNA-3-methyladenine glycosylase I
MTPVCREQYYFAMPSLSKGLIAGDDNLIRCWWPGSDPLYVKYHDTEWGIPVAVDRTLFEKICLEGFQAGLSWLTILRKRENFRRAFRNFEIDSVARFTPRTVAKLLKDQGIIRHRGKIESAINNAKRARELIDEFGSIARFYWRFEPHSKSRPKQMTHAALLKLPKTPESIALSKELRKRGWTFVGPTTTYATMQSVGLVNDHLEGCACRATVEKARRAFKRPQ